MEEIESRFKIIRLAIELTDYKTIDVQIGELGSSGANNTLSEIIALLETKNFRQALYRMDEYLALAKDFSFQRTLEEKSQHSSTGTSTQNIADETLSAPTPKESHQEHHVSYPGGERTLNLEDMLKISDDNRDQVRSYRKPEFDQDVHADRPVPNKDRDDDPLFQLSKGVDDSTSEEKPVDSELSWYEPLADSVDNASADDTLADEPVLDLPPLDSQEKEEFPESEDTFFEHEEESVEHEEDFAEHEQESAEHAEDYAEDKENSVESEEVSGEEVFCEEEKSVAVENLVPEEERRYVPIPYMDQKFRNMLRQYARLEILETGLLPEISSLIGVISAEEYSEQDIQKVIYQYEQYRDEEKPTEAVQMLLLAAATESSFAQLMLARELFRGKVLEQDYSESFRQINHLAEHDYPEAICDLAQFHEHGVGIKKDKKMAILLYEEAAEMGIGRAESNLKRLTKRKGTLFGLLRPKRTQ